MSKMQSLILLMFFLLLPVFYWGSARAQHSGAKVLYRAKLWKAPEWDYDTIQLSPKAKQMLKEIMTNSNPLTYELLFHHRRSIFRKQTALDEASNVLLKVKVGDGVFYYDRKDRLLINREDNQAEVYLIRYPLLQWELGVKHREILGFRCMQATTKILQQSRIPVEKMVTVWYATDLPYNFGPRQFLGLPGLVLGVDFEDGYHLQATSIEWLDDEIPELQMPTKGIRMSLKAYEKMIEKAFNYRRKHDYKTKGKY